MIKRYRKPTLILMLLLVTGALLPDRTLDPWAVLNARKILHLIFALSLIQVLGDLLVRLTGKHAGSILLGFFAGLISSTALTVSVAKRSQSQSPHDSAISSLALLSGTLAMLIEGTLLVVLGSPQTSAMIAISPILGIPLCVVIALLGWEWSKRGDPKHSPRLEAMPPLKIDFRSVLSLTGLIVVALGLSRGLSALFGTGSLFPLTFVISLFEIHGAIIANVQLQQQGHIDVHTLGVLVALGASASVVSKFTLVLILGNPTLKRQIIKWSAWIILAILLSVIVTPFVSI